MPGSPDLIHFHGTYRYPSRERLDHAIALARAVLADDDAGDDADDAAAGAAWMRCFVTRGTVLTVSLTSHIDRFCAATVFETLAAHAIEGAVEARVGARAVDVFPSGDNP